MLRDYRVTQFASLFSDGIEMDAPTSPAERRRQRADVLRESAGRKLTRYCSDITHAMKPRALAGLPGTVDFLVHEKSIGAAGLPDARNSRHVPDGLAGVAADLTPNAIVDAYSRGLFLRWMLGQATFWVPQCRWLAAPQDICEPHALAALLKGGNYHITLDREFDAVVNAATAQSIRRRTPYAPSARGMHVFAALHDAGFAHSVEIRDRAGELAGGLYGVACGRMFMIQARFGMTVDVADLAVLALNRHLQDWGFEILDGCADMELHHLGFTEHSREAHLARIPGSLSGGRPGRWLVAPGLLG